MRSDTNCYKNKCKHRRRTLNFPLHIQGEMLCWYPALFYKGPLTYIGGSERGLIRDSGVCPLTYYVIHEILI